MPSDRSHWIFWRSVPTNIHPNRLCGLDSFFSEVKIGWFADDWRDLNLRQSLDFTFKLSFLTQKKIQNNRGLCMGLVERIWTFPFSKVYPHELPANYGTFSFPTKKRRSMFERVHLLRVLIFFFWKYKNSQNMAVVCVSFSGVQSQRASSLFGTVRMSWTFRLPNFLSSRLMRGLWPLHNNMKKQNFVIFMILRLQESCRSPGKEKPLCVSRRFSMLGNFWTKKDTKKGDLQGRSKRQSLLSKHIQINESSNV